MGMSIRNRVKRNRRRYDIRQYLSLKNTAIFLSVSLVVTTVIIGTSAILLNQKVKNSTLVYSEDKNANQTENVEMANEENTNEAIVEENPLKDIENKKLKDEVSKPKDELDINILGEIMLGGSVTSNLEYKYLQAFKEIYLHTNGSDFTYANFSTNITNLDKLEDVKSKYLVTKDVVSALGVLGLDSVSVASDHIIDYPQDIVKSTMNILEDSDIFVAGRDNLPVYMEKENKKIAIVSTNAVILGTTKKYTDSGISVYSADNMKKNIKEAKQTADVVIADIHWGRDYEYGLTDQMREIAKVAIDSGADMVVGSHALGTYPIVTYKDKPIIYSLGTFISDLDLNAAKNSFIYNINVSRDKKINRITMTPTVVENNTHVRLFEEQNKEACSELLTQMNTWQVDNGLRSKIENGKIVVEL